MEDAVFVEEMQLSESAEDAAAFLRALANPSRLMLLCGLLGGERNVGDLERALGLGQAYVSQQLARLRAEGMVTSRKDGRVVYYALSDDRVRPTIELLYSQFCRT